MKLYVVEAGTEVLLRLANNYENRLCVLSLSQVEFRSAIRKRQRADDIAEDVAANLIAGFQRHLANRFLQQILNEPVIETACGLVDRYGLRAYDSIQLAGCLALRAVSGKDEPTFVCSDRDLLKAAASERLVVLNPGGPQAR